MLARNVFIIVKLYYFQIDFLPTSFENLSRKFPIKTKDSSFRFKWLKNEIHLIFSNYFLPYLLNLYSRLNIKTTHYSTCFTQVRVQKTSLMERFVHATITQLMSKCDALRNLVPFVQFKKRENTHGGVLLLVKLQAFRLQLF